MVFETADRDWEIRSSEKSVPGSTLGLLAGMGLAAEGGEGEHAGMSRHPRNPAFILLFITAALSARLEPVRADVSLPSVFGDHMVLQRDLPVPVWGVAEPGEDVAVVFGGQTHRTKAGSDGDWRVTLDPLVASAEPATLAIEGANRIEIDDVLVGEVWICGGQSNMEWTVDGSSEPALEKATANRPTIRLIKAPHVTANAPQTDIDARWTVCTPKTVGGFTAVGYAFARHLQDELDVPVGLLSINWGGTRIEPWISIDSLTADGISRETMKKQTAAVEEFRSMSEGDRFDREERAKLEHARSSASYIDQQLASDPGVPGGWLRPRFDDSDWKTVDLPRLWKDTSPELGGFDGIVWYRRQIEVPENWAGRNLLLQLGSIDDSDIVWFDGIRVGSIVEAHASPRSYQVPAPIVKAGTRTIIVAVIDSGGAGGFNGPANRMKIGVMDRKAAQPASLSLAGAWKWRRGGTHRGARPSPAPSRLVEPGTRPTDYAALHNAMIRPFAPYAVKGAIWYQGESNAGEPGRYRRFMPMLVEDWGKAFEREELPFGIVQLAAFKAFKPEQPVEEDWPRLREAQSATAAAMPAVGLVVTTDIGDAGDIHPRNKREVGRRMAAWALNDHYERPTPDHASPRIVGCSVTNSRRSDGEGMIRGFRLEVENSMNGLRTRDGKAPDGFAVQGPSGKWHWADVKFGEDGRSITVWNGSVPDPVAVAYAWQNNPERANVVGSSGLPLDQFRQRCE